jgi:hypothetical protein
MTRRKRSILAALVFFAFTAPLGIAAHLISELAGLGWHDDADVFLSARHGYLAAIAVLAFGALLLALVRMPLGERRARVAALVDGLPFGGRGVGFTALSFLAQFGFFAVTQLGEGCPLCGGDIVIGVVAAAIAAAFGALAVVFGQRRVLEFVLALVACFVATDARVAACDIASRRGPRAISARRTPFAFRYRPPPASALRPTT